MTPMIEEKEVVKPHGLGQMKFMLAYKVVEVPTKDIYGKEMEKPYGGAAVGDIVLRLHHRWGNCIVFNATKNHVMHTSSREDQDVKVVRAFEIQRITLVYDSEDRPQ